MTTINLKDFYYWYTQDQLKATGQHPGGAGLLRFPTKQREVFYQSVKEVYREINYTGT